MDYDVKAETLEESFDEVTMRPERPVLAVEPAFEVRAFDGFLRRGETAGVKSFTGATNSDGGFAVPREIDSVIDATLKTISPIRRIANVVRVGTAGYRKLVTQNGVASGWVAETGARPETGTPTFNEIVPPMGDLYANPAASQFMLDDAAFDVEAWLSSEIATEFARAEGNAFVLGTGTNRPRGLVQDRYAHLWRMIWGRRSPMPPHGLRWTVWTQQRCPMWSRWDIATRTVIFWSDRNGRGVTACPGAKFGWSCPRRCKRWPRRHWRKRD
jgi:HK97 family phage major capsid protein